MSLDDDRTHGAPPTMKRASGVRVPLLAALASLAVLLAGLTVFAPRPGLDTHRFVEFGQRLVDAYRGECPQAGCAVAADPMYPGYVLSSLYLRTIAAAIPDSAELATAMFNSLCFAAVAFLVFLAWQRLAPDAATRPFVMLATGLYVLFGLPDIALWSYWMLSESLFLLVVAACVYWTVRGMLSGAVAPWGAAVAIAACGLFVRPTGIVLVPLVLAALLLVSAARLDRSCALRRFAILVLAGMVITFLVGPLVVYLVLSGSDLFDAIPRYLNRALNQAAFFFREGWIVADQPDTYVDTPDTVLEIAGVSLRRFAYYYMPVKSSFSAVHNAVNAVYLVVAVGGAVLGFRVLYRGGRRTAAVALWLVLVALAYGLLHALTIVSYGWRYQVPAMVPLWLLAGVGLMARLGRKDDSRPASGSAAVARTLSDGKRRGGAGATPDDDPMASLRVDGLSCRPRD